MKLRNDLQSYGVVAQTFHWTSAAAFIGAYVIVYYVIWFLDSEAPGTLDILNLHWVLGVLVGIIVIPRLIWKMTNLQPEDPPGSAFEHRLADAAHWGLYGLLILMPLSGYLGTGRYTDFGLFEIPSFRDTDLFAWLAGTFGFTWKTFEPVVDLVHHFIGKWVAWGVVLLHITAALYHHLVRKDNVLRRMLPWK